MDSQILPFVAMPVVAAFASRRAKPRWRALVRVLILIAVAALALASQAPPEWLLPSLRAGSLALFVLDAVTFGFLLRSLDRAPEYRRELDRAFEARLLAVLIDLACLAASLAIARL